ncbi:MAG: hypothetical protein HFH68_08775 [Lachnospiraceae bacterium]|nr:hypothetical protein [Lachnospiraceae bacterium]
MPWFNTKHGQNDTGDKTAGFTHARTRENIKSGEKHSTIFGKIARYFQDLKPVAFTGSYNDLTGKPTAMAPTAHTHTKSQINDFPSTMTPAAHKHGKADITDFPSSMPASDVKAWAKAANKPSYTAAEVGALPASSDLNLKGHVFFGNGAFRISKGYYNGNYHVANFTDLVHETGIGFTSQSPDSCNLHPHKDGGGDLGRSFRWNDIYAVNTSISTSDRREKKDISYIGYQSGYDTEMPDELLAAFINGLKPCIFRRAAGESGRPHHGLIAQDVEVLLQKLGIKDHAALIKSPKMAETEEEAEREAEKEIVQEDGTVKIVTEKVKDKVIRYGEVPDEYVYGIRYEELKGDIIRFCQILWKKFETQEKKIQEQEEKINQQQEEIEDLKTRLERLETKIK